MQARPFAGFGLGLRPEYYQQILDTQPDVDWFEIISENYMVPGGKPLHFLHRIRELYPLAMHGVSLSIGSTDPLNQDYLKQLKELIREVDPLWVSDHLCWTGVNAHNSHDLLPLPYTEEAIRHVARRIRQVQEFLGRRIAIENLSSYVTYLQDEMTEWEFLKAVADDADCLILLDINNVYVSARNHGFDPLEYLRGIPSKRVIQFHVAGHDDYGHYVIDTHDAPVVKPVWDLYQAALRQFGPVSAMIERDDQFPPFEELLAECRKLRDLAQITLGEALPRPHRQARELPPHELAS